MFTQWFWELWELRDFPASQLNSPSACSRKHEKTRENSRELERTRENSRELEKTRENSRELE